MQKKIVYAISLGFIALLTGCQSNLLNFMGNNNSMFHSYPAGATLGQAVQDALMKSGDPEVAQVQVETNINTVILSGYVKKIRQSDTAEQIARQVPGVQTVINKIIVHQ